ncbi:MAG TPA: universal stress protein [Nannocystaceae bacterium]|nr:universal stress protein [Nannocystaceae bacterium]
MKWIVGVDLRETATGALHFSQWLARHASRPARHVFVPVHVLEESYLLQVLRYTHEADVEARALADARAQLARAELDAITEPIKITRGVVADEALVRELDAERADALVIGRQAPSHERHFVRLGRVARRLVRGLPCPIVVAPPDLRVDAIGQGPIVLATDLEETCGAAAKFAHRLALATGRGLVVAHVIPHEIESARYVPTTTIEQFYSQVGLDRQRDLQHWKATHGVAEAASVVAHGDIVARLTAIAEVEGAPMIVCGSRVLGTLERVFATSVATDLSCWAECAIAIVPPTAPV